MTSTITIRKLINIVLHLLVYKTRQPIPKTKFLLKNGLKNISRGLMHGIHTDLWRNNNTLVSGVLLPDTPKGECWQNLNIYF